MSREKVNDKADFTQGSILGKLIPFMIPILVCPAPISAFVASYIP